MLPLLGGYCETHFRFGGISPSLLFRKEPEVIADCPSRIGSGVSCPIVVLINDIHLYPVSIEEIEISVYSKNNGVFRIQFDGATIETVDHPLSEKCLLYHLYLPDTALVTGWNTIHVTISYKNRRNRLIRVENDNLFTASHRPLLCYVASERYPGSEDASFGDFHCHSLHTHSPVEFGAPLESIGIIGDALELDFAVVVDHSYDLECQILDYRLRDPQLNNWTVQQRPMRSVSRCLLFVGEEISGRKERGGVVHLGAVGHREFIRGSGDGARKGYQKNREPSLEQSAQLVTNQGGITFAAHPGERSSLLQKIALRRSSWEQKDFDCNPSAFQAVNGSFDKSWYVARRLWVKLLLQGRRIPLVAGNDAHGDFNRYRAIGFPFLYCKENPNRFFGRVRTGIYSSLTSFEELKVAIRDGATFITDGPFIGVLQNGVSVVGKTVSGEVELLVEIKSSAEFGAIKAVRIIWGDASAQRELTDFFTVAESKYQIQHTISSRHHGVMHYVRCEVQTHGGERLIESMAATSPVWFA